MNIVGALLTLIGVLVAVSVLIVIAGRATGRARRWGLIGAALLLLGSISGAALSLGAITLFRTFDLPATSYGLLSATVVVLRTVGLILIGVAIATRADESTAHDQPQFSL